jgi:hypothetical protein
MLDNGPAVDEKAGSLDVFDGVKWSVAVAVGDVHVTT